MSEQRQPHSKIPTYLVSVCSAFLVALFHLEYPGHFLVGYSFWLVWLQVALVGYWHGGFGDFGLSFHTSGFSSSG